MPGFPLAAIGAGLGIWAKNMQEQQAQRERNALLQMQLQRFQQEQQDRQQQQQEASLEFGLRGGGGVQPTPGGAAAVPPAGGGMPFAKPMPSSGGGGIRAGGGLSIENLTDAALKAGFAPDKAPIIAATFMGESGGNLNAYNPNDPGGSFGVGQFNAAAHPWARETMGNLDLSMRRALELSKGGTDFSPWSVYKSGAYRSYLPRGGTGQGRTAPRMGDDEGAAYAPPAPQARGDVVSETERTPNAEAIAWRHEVDAQEQADPSGTRFLPQQGTAPPPVTSTPGGTNGIVPAGAPRGQQMAQAGPQTATDAGSEPQEQNAPLPGDLRQRLNKIIPPEANGRMSEDALKARIDQLCPNCPPIVKLRALDAESKRLAPLEQEKFKIKMEQYKTQLDAETKMWEHEQRIRERKEDREDKRRLSSSGQVFEGKPGEPLRTIDPNKPELGARPIPGSEGLSRPGSKSAAGGRASLIAGEADRLDKEWLEKNPDASDAEIKEQHFKNWNTAEAQQAEAKSAPGRGVNSQLLSQYRKEHPKADYEQSKRAVEQIIAGQAIERSFGSGQNANQLRAVNTVAPHLLTMRRYAQALAEGDTGVPRANALLQRLMVELGHEDVTNMETASGIAADEMVRLLTSTGGTEADRRKMEDRFRANWSQKQLFGAIRVAEEFVAARFDALEQGYTQGDEKRAEHFEGNMLTPDARLLQNEIRELRSRQSGPTTLPDTTNAPPGPTPPAGSPQSAGPQGAPAGAQGGGGEVIQNGWRYDAKTHQPLGPVRQ